MHMSNGALFGAIGGVVVTVFAYQLLILPRARASGLVTCPPGAAPTAPSEVPRTTPVLTNVAPELAAQIRQKESELAALRQRVAASSAVATEAEKRAEAVEGKPHAWPANLPPAYQGEALESKLNVMLQKTGLGSLADINCDEYPCVAVVQANKGDSNWQKNLQAALKDLVASGEFGPGTNISLWGSFNENENGPPTMLSAIALTPHGDADADLQKRTGNRASAAMSNLK